MKSVIILDFSLGETFVYNYTSKLLKKKYSDSIEEFIQHKHGQITDCQWMCVDKLILHINPK